MAPALLRDGKRSFLVLAGPSREIAALVPERMLPTVPMAWLAMIPLEYPVLFVHVLHVL